MIADIVDPETDDKDWMLQIYEKSKKAMSSICQSSMLFLWTSYSGNGIFGLRVIQMSKVRATPCTLALKNLTDSFLRQIVSKTIIGKERRFLNVLF